MFRLKKKLSKPPELKRATSTIPRRHFGILLSALAAVPARAEGPTLASQFHPYDSLPVEGAGPNHFRPILNGELRTGFAVELHETELGPGLAPHAPHHHVHEELIVVREGLLEVTIAGKSARLGPGSVAFIASDEEHGWRNVGTSSARYLLMALGPDWKYRQSVGSSYSAQPK